MASSSKSTRDGLDYDAVQEFRPRLMSVAYRILGSVVDAEDAVQDAYLSLHNADNVQSLEGFLVTATTRRCIDKLRAARRRESYIGPWLPEPVDSTGEPDDSNLEESLSQGFLLMLERLAPKERAAFILRTVFDYKYSEIGDFLGVSDVYVRQIVRRAKSHLSDSVSRFRPNRERAAELASRFVAACRAGDVKLVEQLLTDDVEIYSDGGGKVTAARVVVRTRSLAARFLVGVFHRLRKGCEMRAATVNGQPGVVFVLNDKIDHVASIGIGDGVNAVYMTVNPDKLSRWSVSRIK